MRYSPDGTPMINFWVTIRQVVSKEGVAVCPQGWKESLSGKNWELMRWFRVTCWWKLAGPVRSMAAMRPAEDQAPLAINSKGGTNARQIGRAPGIKPLASVGVDLPSATTTCSGFPDRPWCFFPVSDWLELSI